MWRRLGVCPALSGGGRVHRSTGDFCACGRDPRLKGSRRLETWQTVSLGFGRLSPWDLCLSFDKRHTILARSRSRVPLTACQRV